MKRKAIIKHITAQLEDIENLLEDSTATDILRNELYGERAAYSEILWLLKEEEAPKALKAPKAPALTVEGAAALTEFIERETTSEQRLDYAGYNSPENKAFYDAFRVLYEMIDAR